MRPTSADLDILSAGTVVVKMVNVKKEILLPFEGKILFHSLPQAAVLKPIHH